jgi:hypothetical protein
MVPPPRGWGWQSRAVYGASGMPSFSRASRRPAGPVRLTLLTNDDSGDDAGNELADMRLSGLEKLWIGVVEKVIPLHILRLFL